MKIESEKSFAKLYERYKKIFPGATWAIFGTPEIKRLMQGGVEVECPRVIASKYKYFWLFLLQLGDMWVKLG